MLYGFLFVSSSSYSSFLLFIFYYFVVRINRGKFFFTVNETKSQKPNLILFLSFLSCSFHFAVGWKGIARVKSYEKEIDWILSIVQVGIRIKWVFSSNLLLPLNNDGKVFQCASLPLSLCVCMCQLWIMFYLRFAIHSSWASIVDTFIRV